MPDTIQNCSINGKRCCNGIREDFTGIHPVSGEKLKCNEWISLKGTDPRSGEPVDNWMCAKLAVPLLIMENANQQRQAGATLDQVKNQIHKQRSEFLGALPEEARERLVRADIKMLENGANPKQ